MHAYDIQQLKKQSPALQEALRKDEQGSLWQFLRNAVQDTSCLWKSTCYHAHYQEDLQPSRECDQCGTFSHATLYSPYNAPESGWCIDCILRAFFTPDTPLYSKYTDPKSPYYDKVYAHNKEVWDHFYDVPDDYDGPPIVIA